ncbi:MAG: PLDc N-terminal domain-containing protein [Mucilaginibacter sp.]
MMPFANSYLYYIELCLQAYCVIHCLRRGSQNKWIWIIIFLPFIGCIAYLYTEVFSSRSMIRKPQIDIAAVINPGSRIRKLEENLKFTDTFSNKISLADAYLAAGETEKAINLYETSLTGAFAENEHGLGQLAIAYFRLERYPDVISTVKKIYKTPQFACSKAHIIYAKALECNGDTVLAENEFKAMKGRYSNFEQRYEYGLFLLRADRVEEARTLFTQIQDEVPHLSSMERKNSRTWLAKSREELKKLPVA